MDKEKRVKLAFIVAYIAFFTLNSLGTAIIVALTAADWSSMIPQMKFLVVVGVFLNWSGTMLAFLNKSASNLSQGKLPTNGGGNSDPAAFTKPTEQKP